MSPVRLELASLERQAGNLAEAQALLQEGIRLEPNNSNFYMPLHFALLAGGQKEEAIALRDGLVQSFPYAAWAWDTAGMMAVSTADFGVAEIYFKRALGLNRTNANINYRLGNLYQHSLDDPQTTIPYYRYAIQLNAGSANYFTNLGTALFKTDQPEAGRAALQYALQLNPNSTTIQNLISEYD
jgi:tetratricopeptide (TPR) repeat protein